MDTRRVDYVARTLAETGTRRGLLRIFSALPWVSGVIALLHEDDVDAARRKRRQKAHHRRKHTSHQEAKDKSKKQKPQCTPEPRSVTCAGRCGNVKNNCKKKVDCGSCACEPPCPVCQTCDARTKSCIPRGTGEPCGDPGQVCQSDGICACTPTTCAAAGKDCGSVDDGCGGTLTCGPCADEQVCNAGRCEAVCLAVREACVSADQCCQDEPSDCQLGCSESLECCHPTPGSCSSDCDCCLDGGTRCEQGHCCRIFTHSCGPEEPCCSVLFPAPDGDVPMGCVDGTCQPLCLGAGNPCDPANSQCCANQQTVCEVVPDCFGVPTCCRPRGSVCGSDCECCGGNVCVGELFDMHCTAPS